MTYYQLLKKRRLDLNLSIQNVSSQTRLAPEYIQAIEEHNLDVFSDDFSFVRYFVHAYCDAIGVNWNVVQKEVDEDIHAYARMRDHALTQAQRRIVTSMKLETTPKKRKKKTKRTPIQKVYSFISYQLLGTKSSRYKGFVTLGIAALIVLCVANVVTDLISSRQQLAYEKEQQQEYKEKEKETEELAKQYQHTKEAKALKVSCQSASDNVWLISNIEKGDCEIKFEVMLPSASIVNLYKNDAIVSDGENTVYSDRFKTSVTITENCTFELQIGTYTDDVKIYVDGKEISYQRPSDWFEGQWAIIRFKAQYNGTDEPQFTEGSPEEDEEEIEYYYDDEAGVWYYYDDEMEDFVYLY